jgi:hypothetical protein
LSHDISVQSNNRGLCFKDKENLVLGLRILWGVFLTQEAQEAQETLKVGLLFWWNMRSFAVELMANLLLTA